MGGFSKEKMSLGEMLHSFHQLSLSFKTLGEAMKKCDTHVNEEMELFMKMIKNFEDPKAVAHEIGQNILINGVDIYQEMSAAYTSYIAKDFEGFGRDVGVAMSLIFIGASNAAKLKPGERDAMMSVQYDSLYPQLNKHIFNAEDNSKYLAFLHYIARNEKVEEV